MLYDANTPSPFNKQGKKKKNSVIKLISWLPMNIAIVWPRLKLKRQHFKNPCILNMWTGTIKLRARL